MMSDSRVYGLSVSLQWGNVE